MDIRGRWWLPVGLAAALTLLNAIKPAVVDDTAYLLMAKHLAVKPLDPYGFEIFWYSAPQPAMEVLMPPVLPYWLSLGVRLFSYENLFLLKLWMFPFSLLLAFSLAFLYCRFAPGWESPLLVMTVLGPAVLPMFSVMLDVPALALGLTAVACMVHGCDTRRWYCVLLAGLLGGLAMQTKYTMLPLPFVLSWYGLLHRRWVGSALVLVFAFGVFVGWETLIASKYDESHFLHHASEQQESTDKDQEKTGFVERVAKIIGEKSRMLFQSLNGYLGLLAGGTGLVAAAALGFPRWLMIACVAIAITGILAVCLTPEESGQWLRKDDGTPRLELPKLVFVTMGAFINLTVLAASAALFFRRSPGQRRGFADADTWFVLGWLAIELASYFALTPFPAARRVMNLAVVGGFVAGRAAAFHRGRMPDRFWIAGYGAFLGLFAFAIDYWDALPEKELPERAAALIGNPDGHTVWFNGHWGFQYYCDRAGMQPVLPKPWWEAEGKKWSVLKAGDWLLFPQLPDEFGFYRPYHGEVRFLPDPDHLELVEEFVADDWLSACTIPPLYGGGREVPIRGRDHPRLQLALYRVRADWVPPLYIPPHLLNR